MVTLATAVDAEANEFDLSDALPDDTKYLLVENELVEVVTPAIRPTQRDDPELKAAVRRNAAGTVASHAQGVTLTALTAAPLGGGGGSLTVTGNLSGSVNSVTEIQIPGMVTELSPGIAGVGLTFYMAGPYHIAFDTPNLVNPSGQGVVLDTFADGALIIGVYLDFITPFLPNVAIAQFEYGNPADWDNTATIFYNDVATDDSGRELLSGQLVDGTVTDGAVVNRNISGVFRQMRRLTAPYLGFGMYITDDQTPNQGAADVYVIVATPA